MVAGLIQIASSALTNAPTVAAGNQSSRSGIDAFHATFHQHMRNELGISAEGETAGEQINHRRTEAGTRATLSRQKSRARTPWLCEIPPPMNRSSLRSFEAFRRPVRLIRASLLASHSLALLHRLRTAGVLRRRLLRPH